MRLFTAVWPSDDSRRHLAAAVDAARRAAEFDEAAASLRRFRWVPSERWHLTLRFHGDDADPDDVGRRLADRVASLPRGDRAPRLRLAGAGVFRTTLWVGAEPAGEQDAAMLRSLVGAAGGDPDSYVAHLTVARWGSGRPRAAALTEPLRGYVGPWWPVRDLAVVSSERTAGQPVYRTLSRVPAAATADTPPAGEQG